ncbi:MAG: DMT family transporter [Alphaproteobacteria bacterium]
MRPPPDAQQGAGTRAQQKVPISALLLMGFITIIWGFNWPIMKVGLSEIPPWVFRSCASTSGVVGLFLIAWFRGYSLSVPKGQRRLLIFCALLNMTIWNMLVMYGVDAMNSGRAAILAYTMPLWASLAGIYLMGEGITKRAMAGLALGMSGMAFLFFAEGITLGNSFLGPLLILGAAISWGLGTTLTKYSQFTMPVVVMLGWQHLIGVIPILPIAIFWDVQNLGTVTLYPALAVLFNMTFTAILCYLAYFYIVTTLPVVVSTMGIIAVPLMGVFADALIFGTQPTLFDYFALCAVLGALYLIMLEKREKNNEER